MKRCLELAKNGLPAAMPNPAVGAVLVYNDTIIGEGFTAAFGRAHAEVKAVASVKDKTLLDKATLYVSLEPCCHFGKTPPCADLIIKNKIPKVVIGIEDPNEKVTGKGIQKLKDFGIAVTVGILEKECREINIRFFTFHTKKRPYIILKWAESSDGFIAPTAEFRSECKKPYWISNEFSRQLTHKWRSEEQAILVGTHTIIDDNPKLNVRDWSGNNPIKIVLDQNNRIPKENYIFDTQSKTIVISASTIDYSKKIGEQIVRYLFEQDIQSVIIEGGTKTIQTFIDENIWDEARIFKGMIALENGIPSPKFKGNLDASSSILNDELLIFLNHD